MTGFAAAAESYAKRGCAVIPCGGPDGKKPLVRWRRMTADTVGRLLPQWREKFAGANPGILTGPSRITGIDIDSPGDAIVSECLARFGDTPLIAKTPRGGHHLYFRNSGEHTAAKIDGRPIDVRGIGGFIVVAPGETLAGRYQFVRGSVDDLDRLPAIKPGALPMRPASGPNRTTSLGAAGEGRRNVHLWRLAMTQARTCETRDELEARVLILNESECSPPLDPPEVARIVRSAWDHQRQGKNWVGVGGARVFLEFSELERLTVNPDAAVLLMALRRSHLGVRDSFAVSPRSMATSGQFSTWSEKRIRGARQFLIDVGELRPVHAGGRGNHDPSLFCLRNTATGGMTEGEMCNSDCGQFGTTKDASADYAADKTARVLLRHPGV